MTDNNFNSRFIIIGSYVGEGVSGSHRQERFIFKALEENFKVTLLKPFGHFQGIHDFISKKSFEDWKRDNPLPKIRGSVKDFRFKKYIVKLKYLFFLDLIGFGFLKTFFLLSEIEKREKGNEFFLLVSSPSFSLAFATYIYSFISKSNFSYSIDMRDAWAMHPNIKTFNNLRKWIEGKILRKACKVLTISVFLKNEFDLNYGIKTTLLYNATVNLLNITSEATTQKHLGVSDILQPDYINICYFGSLPTGFYNLNDFCKGLSGYLENTSSVKKIRFYFFGPCAEMEKIAKDYNSLSGIFHFRPSIAHELAISLMRECDAVLFFGFNGEKNSGIVSTKIFEYFYLGCKMILFDIRRDSDLDFLISKVCCQSVFINNAEDFKEYLCRNLNDLNLLPCANNYEILKELDNNYNLLFRGIKYRTND
jgi:glycosyltransferase involved in cell wall biosynthesis